MNDATKSSTRLVEEALEEARQEGYEDGHADGMCEAEDRAYCRGYDDALEEQTTLSDTLARAGFDALEDFVGRYDAARRVWTFSQGGREVDVSREELR